MKQKCSCFLIYLQFNPLANKRISLISDKLKINYSYNWLFTIRKKSTKNMNPTVFFLKLTKLICTYCNKRRSCKDTIMHYLYSPKMKPITQCSILDLSTYCTSTVNHSNKITFQLSIIPQMSKIGSFNGEQSYSVM